MKVVPVFQWHACGSQHRPKCDFWKIYLINLALKKEWFWGTPKTLPIWVSSIVLDVLGPKYYVGPSGARKLKNFCTLNHPSVPCVQQEKLKHFFKIMGFCLASSNWFLRLLYLTFLRDTEQSAQTMFRNETEEGFTKLFYHLSPRLFFCQVLKKGTCSLFKTFLFFQPVLSFLKEFFFQRAAFLLARSRNLLKAKVSPP